MLCPVCNSVRLSIPCNENLTGIVTRLIDRGIEVSSASCDILHDIFDDITGKGYIGKTVQIQIELGCLYPADMFKCLPPDWLTYEYHTIAYRNHIGAKYARLSHSNHFILIEDVDAECEFATALTISNMELWLDSTDADGYKSVWTLAGEL